MTNLREILSRKTAQNEESPFYATRPFVFGKKLDVAFEQSKVQEVPNNVSVEYDCKIV